MDEDIAACEDGRAAWSVEVAILLVWLIVGEFGEVAGADCAYVVV